MKTWSVVQALTLLSVAYMIGATVVKFTNLECKTFHPDKAEVKTCHLKVVGRNKVSQNIHIKNLYKQPVDNITINFQLMRKGIDYRPFLYNVTSDFCKFMKRTTTFLFMKLYIDELRRSSNINHTCPYSNDVIVDNFIISNKFLRMLPFAPGNYMVRIKLYVQNELQALVKSYFSIVDH